MSAGPEKYMFGLTEILKEKGHEVIPFSVRNSKNKRTKYEKYFTDPIGGKDSVFYSEYKKTPKTVINMIGKQFYSFEVKRKLKKLIKDTKPDIAYLLHHINKLSPSVIDACKQNNLPVVMRLSDFFLVCPDGHLYRNKQICEECIKGSLFSAIKHRCVKKSLIASIIKSAAMKFHRVLKIYKKVDCIISPSEFTINKVKHILKGQKLVHIPTFVINKEKYNPKIGNYLLFVGRIEEHKGILDAIKSVEGTKYALKIVGASSTGYDKVLSDYIKNNNIKNVELLGPKFGAELKKLYQNCRAVVIPALWYENLPNVALEAMMFSRPIIASGLGSLKYIIKDNHNGLLFKPGNISELRDRIKTIFENEKLCLKLGKNSYKEASKTYNPEKHYNKLIALFNKLVVDKDE